jgi:lipopolysaccharide export system permease protein
LRNANIYEIGRKKGHVDRSMNVQGMVMNPNRLRELSPTYSSVAASTAHLAGSGALGDVAEFQWRLSTAISTLLLAMLGVPLSRAQPRQSRFTKVGTAIFLYFAYYLLCTSARTWVQNGVVGPFPGIWWAPALLGAVVMIAFAGPELRFKYSPRPA